VKEAVSKPESTCGHEPLLKSLEARLAAMERRLDRADREIATLKNKLARAEAENARLQKRVRELTAENKELKKKLKESEAKVASLEKQLAWFQKDKFGKRSETNPFRRLEYEESESDASDSDSSCLPAKRSRGQQAGAKGHGRSDRSELPEEEVVLEVANCICPDCLKPYEALASTDDSSVVELEQLLYKLKYKRKKYVAQCRCRGSRIVTASPAPRLYPKTSIGNSLWIHLCVWKFLHGVPTNRLLKDLSLRGLKLAAGTVTGGFKIIDDLITPLYEAVNYYCQSESYWNADETSWRVFSENDGRRSGKKWWLWVIAGQRAVSYILDPSRSRHVPIEFLAHSQGLLMTDRFSAYKSLPKEIDKVWCWVHVRRDFLKIYEGMPKSKAWAKSWLLEISKLFVLHHSKFKLFNSGRTLGEDWLVASNELETHVENLKYKWMTELEKYCNKEQRTALQSLRRHWVGLTKFLSDIRIPLDNNRAERLLRGCVINRKNSYGSGVEWAGQLSAKMFSLFQTWLINGLDPQALLLDYFNECSKTPGKPPPNIMKFLPWNMTDERKQEFCLPRSYSRPS